MAAGGQCTYVWSAATQLWDKVADCDPLSGTVCAQNPNTLGITGEDGDVWISPCVVTLIGKQQKTPMRRKSRAG